MKRLFMEFLCALAILAAADFYRWLIALPWGCG